jgi:hypothetical protein
MVAPRTRERAHTRGTSVTNPRRFRDAGHGRSKANGSSSGTNVPRLSPSDHWGRPVSLTDVDHLFVGVHEDGANDFITALFKARPRLLNYASDPFVSSTSIAVTHMAPIAFPGVPGGLGWAVSFSIPEVDFFPQTLALAPPLPGLATNELSLRSKVTLIVNCAECRTRDPKRDTTDRDRADGASGDDPADAPNDDRAPDIPRCKAEPTEVTLEIQAVGRPIATYYGPGSGEISFRLEAVEIVDITPDALETVLECLLRMVLQAVLDTVRLPFHALSAGAFTLALTRGPEIADDRLKIWGTT